jgi:hypothetical protein
MTQAAEAPGHALAVLLRRRLRRACIRLRCVLTRARWPGLGIFHAK